MVRRSTRKVPLSLKSRNSRRRQQRKFSKLFLNHQLLLSLLAINEIGNHINEIERVLIDFYTAGYFEGHSDGWQLAYAGIEAAMAKIEQTK